MLRLRGIRGSGNRVDHDARSRQRAVDRLRRRILAGATRVRGAAARCCNARDRCAALARRGGGRGSAAGQDTRRVSQGWRLSRRAKLALIALWAVIVLLVLTDLSEYVRGDPSLMPILPWNFVVAAILSAVILAIEVVARFASRFARPSY